MAMETGCGIVAVMLTVAVNGLVAGVFVAAATGRIVKAVPEVIVCTVDVGSRPWPLTSIPTRKPAVLSQVTTPLLCVVLQFVRLTVVVLAVAGALMVKCVASCTETTVAFAGTPGPALSFMPGPRFSVEAQVTAALPDAVLHFVKGTASVAGTFMVK